MDAIEKIRGKKLLIVDDEQDILDTLIDSEENLRKSAERGAAYSI